jgi:hypothetical protein
MAPLNVMSPLKYIVISRIDGGAAERTTFYEFTSAYDAATACAAGSNASTWHVMMKYAAERAVNAAVPDNQEVCVCFEDDGARRSSAILVCLETG